MHVELHDFISRTLAAIADIDARRDGAVARDLICRKMQVGVIKRRVAQAVSKSEFRPS